MSNPDLIASATSIFTDAFGTPAEVSAYAPGRVNLLGEHTDYNGGYVLPMPLSLGIAVAMDQRGTAGSVEMVSTSFDGTTLRDINGASDESWSDYIIGSLQALLGDATSDTGIRISVATDLPVGSGLSSSAALEVAVIRAANELFSLGKNPVDIALLARSAENNFVGVPCGIMDQFSVSVGTPGQAIFLATRDLTYEKAPIPDSHNLVIIHSGVSHKLSEDGYETRVKECRAACAELGVEMLSDLSMDDMLKIDALPDPLAGRARHIVSENDRVLRGIAALNAGETTQFAELMLGSHASQRDDYAVSVAEVDQLVEGAMRAGATGARLTGGGFGGSIVALVDKTIVEKFSAEITENFPNARILAVT